MTRTLTVDPGRVKCDGREANNSSANGSACVDVAARPAAARVLVRHTKDRLGPTLVLSAEAWARFTAI